MEEGQLQVPGLGGTTVGPRRCAVIMPGDKDAAGRRMRPCGPPGGVWGLGAAALAA